MEIILNIFVPICHDSFKMLGRKKKREMTVEISNDIRWVQNSKGHIHVFAVFYWYNYGHDNLKHKLYPYKSLVRINVHVSHSKSPTLSMEYFA